MQSRLTDLLASKRGVRVIGDVHGMRDELEACLAEARALDLAPVFVGDITDRGPDSPGCMRLVLDAVREGAFVPGNHCWRFARWANGNNVKMTHGLAETVEQLAAAPDGRELGERFADLVVSAPVYLRFGPFIIAHAGFSPDMTWNAPFALKDSRQRKARGQAFQRALYGMTDGTTTPEGFPNQAFDWVDEVPNGVTVLVGHSVRSDTVMTVRGARGGSAVFLDTGAGKGGRLSWVDIPSEDILGKETTVEPAAFTDADGQALLTILVGPSGSGKSTWAAARFPSEAIVSTDALRAEIAGDFREQSVSRRAFTEMYARAAERLAKGLPVVLDATFLRARDRKDAYGLVPAGAPVRVVVIDRPLEEKLATGAWRLDEPKDANGVGLIERHDALFRVNLAQILKADGHPTAVVEDLRR